MFKSPDHLTTDERKRKTTIVNRARIVRTDETDRDLGTDLDPAIVTGIETGETEIEDEIVGVVTEVDRETERGTEEIDVVVVTDPDPEIVRDLETEMRSVIRQENVERTLTTMTIMT